MTTKEATADMFWTAFKALPKREREAIVACLLMDQEFGEDLMDLALIEHARGELDRDELVRKSNARKMT